MNRELKTSTVPTAEGKCCVTQFNSANYFDFDVNGVVLYTRQVPP